MNVDRPLLKRVYQIALPAAGSFILGTLYAINDFFWAGRISPTAINAIGLCMMVLIFNYGLSAMVQKGVLSLVARLRGMEDHRGIAMAAAQGLTLNLLCSLLILAAGWVLAPWVLGLMGGEGETLKLAILYLRLMYLGYPLMSMAAIVDGVFIGLGDTKTVFRLQLLGVALNTAFERECGAAVFRRVKWHRAGLNCFTLSERSGWLVHLPSPFGRRRPAFPQRTAVASPA